MPSLALPVDLDPTQAENVKQAQALRDGLGSLASLNERRALQVRKINDARRNLIESKKRGFLGKLMKGDAEQAEAALKDAEAALAAIDQQIEDFGWKAPALDALMADARTESEAVVAERIAEQLKISVRKIDEHFTALEAEIDTLAPLSAAIRRHWTEFMYNGSTKWRKGTPKILSKGPTLGVTDFLQRGNVGELAMTIKIWRSHAKDAGLLP